MVRWLFLLRGALLCGALQPHSAAAIDNASAIRKVIGATWDKPDAKVDVDPIAIVDNYAIAGWTQSQRGGRALLQRREQNWIVVLCAGDALKNSADLIASGVPAAIAPALAEQLAQSEKMQPKARLQKFSTFSGMVTIDEHHRPPAASHHH